MRVKVGSTWYECKLGQPIMVELSPGERQQIADMPPTNDRYAHFHDDEPMTKAEMFEWMEGGSNAEVRAKNNEGSQKPEGDS